MLTWCYKWLPIIFGCHCRPDRSFFIRGKQFPICARCTGMLAGVILAIVLYAICRPHWVILVVLLIPLIADGTIQKKTAYTSTNTRRFITGILFGYAFLTLLVMSFVATFKLGQSVGIKLLK